MKIRWSFGAVLLVLVLAAGCSATARGGVARQPQGSGALAPAAGSAAQGTNTESPVAVPSGDGESGATMAKGTDCSPMTDSNAAGYLAKLSGYSPQTRVGLAIDQAAEVFGRQADAVKAGWPILATNQWAADAWFKVGVQGGDGIALIELSHGDRTEKDGSRFYLWCDQDNNWVVSKIGSYQSWYALAPAQVENQNGQLTNELAQALVEHVLWHFGNSTMRVSATGKELERGRLWANVSAAGGSLSKPQILTDFDAQIKVESRSADEGIGTWTSGKLSGEKVLFKREAGLWKMADHTEKGQWLSDKPAGYTGPMPLRYDQHLLGISLGMTRTEVTGLIGKPDAVNGSQETYGIRNLVIEYDGQGRVMRITASTGTTARGLTIGSTPEAVANLYGSPTQQLSDQLVYKDGGQALRLKMVKSDGGQVVKSFTLERTQ